MRKKWYLALLLVCVLFLCACADLRQGDDALQMPAHTQGTGGADAPGTAVPEPELPDDSGSETVPPEEERPDHTQENTEPPQPVHSELYLPDCTAGQMTEYFEEVVLHTEYSDGTGEDYLVQKWLSPIRYRVFGTPTDTDNEVLDALVEQLNSIPGFPGICAAEDGEPEDVSISFLEREAFETSFSVVTNGEDSFGAVQYWYYTQTNELYAACIGCRTDIDQDERNSVLVEEVINMLGISDTVLRPDSITYQYSNENTALSEIDLVILKLLYDPAIACGMDAGQCAGVIRELYY